MTEKCTTLIDRDELLVGYLYDDIDPASRAAFEAHMTTCAVCRDELRSLQGVRQNLAKWQPEPYVVSGRRLSTDELRTSNIEPRTLNIEPRALNAERRASNDRRTPNPERRTAWMQLPAWAQVAAALLFVGVAAGIANLDVHRDSSGWVVRTGWMKPVSPAPADVATNAQADTASHADLAALEQRLRGELRALQTSGHADGAQPVRVSADADVMRRARALIDDAEKRQQRELALRIGEVLRDVNAQRQADLVRIDRSLGLVQNNLGVEVLKQRERVNYLMRVNQSVPVR